MSDGRGQNKPLEMAERLGEAIRCETVAPLEGSSDYSEFDRLYSVFEANYPLVHAAMGREIVDGHSLLYRWKGTGEKAPVILMGHMDVVPASESGWKYPPFGGRVEEGYVWGRGAIDMKGQLVAILEACEALLSEGFVPERDVYLSFGHNEESANDTGAMEAAKLLSGRGVRPALVLDEGAHLMKGETLGVRGDIVGIAVCEKGYADVAVRAKSMGGHASVPGGATALGRVCRAVERLERHPMRMYLKQPVKGMVSAVSGAMPFPYRFFAKTGLFPGAILRYIGRTGVGRALTGTTMAATMAKGSAMPNVLPGEAEIVLNCRLAPWDSLDSLLEHMHSVIKDESVSIHVLKSNAASSVADARSRAFRLVEAQALKLYPDALPVPYMMLAATDSRYFQEISDCVLRFSPLGSMREDHAAMHAANERVSIESLYEAAGFFKRLLVAAQQGLE